ncbi:MAG: type III secretion system outer membrane ring subunit SctC [Succinivibrio sp.]
MLVLVFAGFSADAASFRGTYSHYSKGEDLTVLLSDFATSQGYSSSCSNEVKGNISGRFDKVSPKKFLDGIKAAFSVSYYSLGKTLFFYADRESTQAIFRPSSVEPTNLVSSLKSAGVVADELPVRVDASGMLLVNGPEQYVKTITELAQRLDKDQERQVVMEVFKLKHAKADDYEFTNSDKTVIIPGVASILQRMVSGGSPENSSIAVTVKSQQLTGLKGSGLASTAKVNDPASSPVSSNSVSTGNEGFTPTITSSSRLNAVIINDYRYRMPFYKKVITELDVPVKLVELHAAIIDIDVDATDSLGIDWNASKKSGKWTYGGASGSNTLSGTMPTNGRGGGIFSTVFNSSSSTFMMQVNMLEEDNKAKTLGRPSILTFDNVEATLEDTTTSYIKVEGYQDSDLFQIVSGTVLRVTPHIIDDGSGEKLIQMVISIQTNQNTDGNVTVTEGNVPTVKQTRINTQAVVRQGQSLLLGGYYVENKSNTNSGIPGLKNAPLVGALFGSDSDTSYKRERLLMITPRILELDDSNVPNELELDDFERTAMQADYAPKIKKKANNTSGCSSNRAN